MIFNVTNQACSTPSQCGSDAAENPPECSNPLYSADHPETCTDSNGNPVTIVGLSINPPSGSVDVGKSYPFQAFLTFSDGRKKDVTTDSTWTSVNESIATVASTGYASGVAVGITTVKALFRTYPAFAQITVEAACVDGAVDFVLVIDRSGSMQATGSDGKQRMTSALEATIGFIRNVEFTTDRVAVVSFSGTLDELSGTPSFESNVTVHTTLTNDQSVVEAAIAAIAPDFDQCVYTDPSTGRKRMTCLTGIGDGLQAAYDELTGVRASTGTRKCVILLTDGGNNLCAVDPEDVAQRMQEENFMVCVIGLAIGDGDGMARCAGKGLMMVKDWLPTLTNCDLFFDAPTVDDLPDVYASLPRLVCGYESDPCFYYPDATTAFEWVNTSTEAQNGVVGQEYSYSFAEADNPFGIWSGDGSITWTIEGDLPPGLEYNRWTKTIEGTPTTVGSYDFTITGDNGIDPTPPENKTLSYSITIIAA